MNKKVMLGMSGGVDSAVSAYLLNEQGYDVTGVTCRFLKESQADEKNINDARCVASILGIGFESLTLSESFDEKVISSFCRTYAQGGTPNPCVECNKHLKFGAMLDYALEKGFDFIATGHYARIERDENTGRFLLKKGADLSKDQSYVLYVLNQHQLSHALFPLGSMTKDEARLIADRENLVSAQRSDSQDICFVPDGDYARFIESYLNISFPEGEFVRDDGRILGTHKGIIRYTVGQRRGLGLALPAPLYVMKKDTESNRVILCDNETLFSKTLTAKNINLITCDELHEPIRVKAKVRYKHAEQWATVTQTDADTLKVVFDEPQRAIAKGQSVVLYDGDTVVGGGTIL